MNGDRRADILTPKGWFEAPADPRGGGWTQHADWGEKAHLGFLHVLDVNGDGRSDVVTTDAARLRSLIWFEQGAGGALDPAASSTTRGRRRTPRRSST